jgi:hypothetical protein
MSVSDEEARAAKDALDLAIRTFHGTMEPEALVSGWVLITHRVSDEWDAGGQSAVGMLPMTGQPFPMTRGLLDVALEGSRADGQ